MPIPPSDAVSYPEFVRRNNPESFYVFVVGTSNEWDEGRDSIGDAAMHREYLNLGVPPEQCIFVRDEQATKSNCEEQLATLLESTETNSTLVFYYDGHGQPTYFETWEEEWEHQQVIRLIDSLFNGDRVILLVDCCASGNICRWLGDMSAVTKGKHSFLCLCSTEAYVEAGPEWTLTQSWIRALRCARDGNLPLSLVVDFLSDEQAREKGDILVAYATATIDPDSTTWLPRHSGKIRTSLLRWRRLKDHIPADGKVDSTIAVGDQVYYKHPGGPVPLDVSRSEKEPRAIGYVFPVWLPAIVQSTFIGSSQLEILVQHQSGASWKVKCDRRELMNEFHMGHLFMIPGCFHQVQLRLSEQKKYYDFSWSAHEEVQVFSKSSDCFESALIAEWKDVDWNKFLESGRCESDETVGPYVAIIWKAHDLVDVITTERIQSFDRNNPIPSIDGIDPQRRALYQSISSSGKTVSDARMHFKAIKGSKWECYWPEDGDWYGGEPLDPFKVSLDVLASHVIFRLRDAMLRYCTTTEKFTLFRCSTFGRNESAGVLTLKRLFNSGSKMMIE